MIAAIGCSRKAVPTISMPPVKIDNTCDSIIQALIDSIRAVTPVQYELEQNFDDNIPTIIVEHEVVDTNDVCKKYKLSALEMAKKYNDIGQQLQQSKKEAEFYKALAQIQARKIINNYNSNNKNTQIGDANISQNSKKGDNQSGEGNINQDSKNGPNQNGNDNTMTTKKNNWWWIFLCGMLFMFLIQNVGFRILKTYFPFLKFLP